MSREQARKKKKKAAPPRRHARRGEGGAWADAGGTSAFDGWKESGCKRSGSAHTTPHNTLRRRVDAHAQRRDAEGVLFGVRVTDGWERSALKGLVLVSGKKSNIVSHPQTDCRDVG